MKEERQKGILEILKEKNYATVGYLSKSLYASEPTLRRDLNELARKNLIVRSHGGAMLKSEHNTEVPLTFRNAIHFKEKSAIAKRAAELISDGDVIFLDASTTVFHILKYLDENKNITVVTNSLRVATVLCDTNIKTYLIGGALKKGSYACGGGISEEIFDRFNIDLFFFSSYGFLSNGLIQDYSEEETSLRIKALNSNATSVFLCDKSKLGKTSLFNVANIADVDYFITDATLPKSFPCSLTERIVI